MFSSGQGLRPKPLGRCVVSNWNCVKMYSPKLLTSFCSSLSVGRASLRFRSSRHTLVGRLARTPNLSADAFRFSCFVLGGRVLPPFVVRACSSAVDSSLRSPFSLCSAPCSASLRPPALALRRRPATAPLSVGRFLPPSLWLVSLWLLCLNRLGFPTTRLG